MTLSLEVPVLIGLQIFEGLGENIDCHCSIYTLTM